MDATSGTILIDASPESAGELEQVLLERLGHPVLLCPGPERGTLCPILAGSFCPKLEAARGIVFRLDLDRPQHRVILERYLRLVPAEVPIRVVATSQQWQRYAGPLAGVQVWLREPIAGDLDGLAAQVETLDRLTASAA